MSEWSREAAIAMERRHVADGQRRIERQEALIAKLVQKSTTELIPLAAYLLSEFREAVEMSKARLQALERESE
jgi:hypothetical protein